MAWAHGFAGGVLRRAGRDVPTVTVPEASGGGGRRGCHGDSGSGDEEVVGAGSHERACRAGSRTREDWPGGAKTLTARLHPGNRTGPSGSVPSSTPPATRSGSGRRGGDRPDAEERRSAPAAPAWTTPSLSGSHRTASSSPASAATRSGSPKRGDTWIERLRW